MLSIPPRTPFYAFLLILGFLQFIATLQISSSDSANSPYLPLFGTVCAIVALFTCILVFFLLGYGRSEFENKSFLTRCDTHLASFGIISFLWLCLCVFLTINTKNECDRHTILCQPLRYSAIVAFIMFLLALCSAAIVTYSVAIAGLRYDKHVEYARERALERSIELELQARSRERSRTNNDRNGQYISLGDLSPTTRPPPVYTVGRSV